MNVNRRNFLKSTAMGSLAASVPFVSCGQTQSGEIKTSTGDLDKILNAPVLKRELFPSPVIMETIELIRYENNFICRIRTKDGAEGISVSNNMQMVSLYPIFINRIQPFFIGKDARDLDRLLEEVYVFKSNYKLQSLAIWVPLATLEFAVLDLLGKIANKPMGELIGEIHNREIAVYQANNNRGRSAEESIERIKQTAQETQAKAIKFKIGGRMSREDEPPGRTEKLIPLVRKTFGDDMTIYADSNGSYDVEEAIRIGKILQEYKIDFYEEPVPFDWYEETKAVAEALTIPIAGGEQEPSIHQFKWLIENDGLQIVQPDIFYFGGMIRSMKIALMADSMGKTCVPHISGSGLGYLYMMHYVSAIPNAGPYHEFKGFNNELPFESTTTPINSEGGVVTVPTGPGLGVRIDPDYLAKHQVIKL